MEKKVALHNLGCKVNAYELEAMEQMLKNAGYEIVPLRLEQIFISLIPVRLQTLQTANQDRCFIRQRK